MEEKDLPLLKNASSYKRKVDTTRLLTGTKVGQYIIQNEIDRGGMAVVYRAQQLGLDRNVALKVLPPSISIQGKFIDRFQKEAKSIAQLTHPNIVRIIEVGGDAGIYFIAMEYLDGLNLYKYMNKFEPTVYSVVQIMRQLTEALEYAHGRNIIHRDLKLNNVIMKDNAIPVLIDFGLAKAREADSGLTISGEILGSPSYMSPEQALGQHVDERTDIYSLGIMFYEMLAGRNPFFDKRGYQQTIWNVLHGEVRRLREISDWIPRDVETIVMKCMEKDREKRYQTMRALRLDLERFQIGEPIMARSPNLFEKIARNVRKRRGVYLSMFIITFLLSLFFAYYYYQQSLEKADWDHIILKPGFYFNLDAEWNGRRGEAGELLKFLTMESPWVGSPDRIQVVSEDYTWISWKEEVRNDIRLDFTVQIERENSREFGCFIHGTNPDNGYSFRFQSGRVFLTKGSRNSIMDIADIPDFMAKEQLIIHVEKNDYLIRLSVNGETKILFNDYTPLSGTDNHSFGFYVDNAGIIVSDVALYNLGVPFKTKPIQTAERFFERSYYQDAIEEYRNIIRLYPSDPMAARARFKIGLAYVRMGDHEKAIAEFENILRFGSEELVPYAMGEIVNAYSALQKTAESRSTLLRLRDQFPKSASIIRILSDYNSQIIGLVKKGEPDSLYQAKEVLDFLVNDFRGYGPFFLPAYLAYGESFMDKGQFEKAASVFSAIDLRFSEKLETAVISKVRLADIEAFSGSTEKAQTAYNDILTRYHKNKPVCAEAWMGIAMINRVQGNAGDAIKCYNFVMDEFSMFRDLCAKSLLSAAMTYLEKEAPQELAYNLFKKLISHYRDCPGQVVVARFLTGEIDEAEFRQKGGAPLTDYYIAEKFRTQGNGIRALEQYQRFEKKIKGNRLLMRLAEKQIAYLRR